MASGHSHRTDQHALSSRNAFAVPCLQRHCQMQNCLSQVRTREGGLWWGPGQTPQELPVPLGEGVPVPLGEGVPVPLGTGVPVPLGEGVPVPLGKRVPVPSGKGLPLPLGRGLPVPLGRGLPAPLASCLGSLLLMWHSHVAGPASICIF